MSSCVCLHLYVVGGSVRVGENVIFACWVTFTSPGALVVRGAFVSDGCVLFMLNMPDLMTLLL